MRSKPSTKFSHSSVIGAPRDGASVRSRRRAIRLLQRQKQAPTLPDDAHRVSKVLILFCVNIFGRVEHLRAEPNRDDLIGWAVTAPGT